MAGVVKPKKAGRNYQFWFRDYRGRRKWGTGTKSRTETLAIARRMEDEHRQIRLGYRDLPVPKRKDRSFFPGEHLESISPREGRSSLDGKQILLRIPIINHSSALNLKTS